MNKVAGGGMGGGGRREGSQTETAFDPTVHTGSEKDALKRSSVQIGQGRGQGQANMYIYIYIYIYI